MNRRKFLFASVAGGAALSAAGVAWLNLPGANEKLTVEAALAKLHALMDKNTSSTGQWTPYQIFSHAAQSIEYSMTGYPGHKGDLFKSLVGRPAFLVFSAKRYLRHGLSEPLPNAPAFEPAGDVNAALRRLVGAFTAFAAFKGELKPHFAYGLLTKEEYEAAHVMHLNNHLEEIVV